LRLIILGPSGAGKGTQAKRIADYFGMRHVSTGDILREEIRRETELGKSVEDLIDSGNLVDDEIMIPLVDNFIKEDNFILDGFPRTLNQALALDEICRKHNTPLDLALLVDVPDGVIVERITGRKACPKCGAVFHKTFFPPKKEGVCDNCRTPLIQREDDTHETVERRLLIYHELTEPIVQYYEEKNLLSRVNGLGDANEINNNLKNVIHVVRVPRIPYMPE